MSTTPHDALFKAIFSQPEQAREVLALSLPAAVLQHIDMATLAQVQGSYVDDSLRAQHTDLLFSLLYAGRPARLYFLLEHQSTPPPWMALRLYEYMGKIWRALADAKPRPTHLPIIIPVVIYHGAAGWRAATNFESLFDPEAPAPLHDYMPKFRFLLDDLGHHDDDELMRRAMSAISRLALSALRHARSAEDLARFAPRWTELVREVLREPNGARAIQLVFRYLCEVRGEQEVPILRQIAIRAANEANMRTIADMFRDEGIDEGERTLLRRQLRTRFGELPEPLAVRLDKADRSTLERIADRILSASSLDEVFAG